MSSVIDAVASDFSDTIAAGIDGALQQVHHVSIMQMEPYQEQQVTQAPNLAIGSSVANAGTPVSVASPSLSSGAVVPASFSLSAETLAEISSGFGRIGIMATQWAVNPWATETMQQTRQPVSLVLTVRGKELAVSNLSSPIVLSLPSVDPNISTAEQVVTLGGSHAAHAKPRERVSRSLKRALFLEHRASPPATAPIRDVVAVFCQALNATFDISSPDGNEATWTIECPRAAIERACSFWNGREWSSEGCTTVNSSANTVECECSRESSPNSLAFPV